MPETFRTTVQSADIEYFVSFDVRADASRFIVAINATRQLVTSGLIDAEVSPLAIVVVYDDPAKPLPPEFDEDALVSLWDHACALDRRRPE